MLSFAFGEMGMSPYEFYSMTIAQYALKARGFRKANVRKWEHTRKICHVMATIHSTQRIPREDTWWPLETDEKEDVFLDAEKMNDMWERAMRNGSGVKGTD